MLLGQATGRALVQLARSEIEEKLGLGRAAISDAPGFAEKRAAFVTLKIHEDLRGCIGTTVARDPLRVTVPEMARAAAFEDPRFEPVARHEIHEISVEVSVLTPPEPLTDLARVEIGRHGLVLSGPAGRGLLLPQVATEHGFTREDFLSATCQKSGLPPDAWLRFPEKLRWMSFEAEIFSE